MTGANRVLNTTATRAVKMAFFFSLSMHGWVGRWVGRWIDGWMDGGMVGRWWVEGGWEEDILRGKPWLCGVAGNGSGTETWSMSVPMYECITLE
eukprot:CAMPEP_0184675402 /NCGR_PEP_ID=MMETSP0308-20130426/87769_1 /TAXON_ID=38269 /ORGANISM="Gloeochaete witrockiana, Strain SAG 46.84" /LENGTH=93 /DNA_ID=CAMNT_0027123101 /DNA_START=368 /DNA_END=649 /DNA_ORIENTATION=+